VGLIWGAFSLVSCILHVHTVILGMAIQVQVLGHPRVLDPMGAGAILHPWVHPQPTRTGPGASVGFNFHSWVKLKLENRSKFGPVAAQPSHLLSISHTYISIGHRSIVANLASPNQNLKNAKHRRRLSDSDAPAA
jgi:hypothetical protein